MNYLLSVRFRSIGPQTPAPYLSHLPRRKALLALFFMCDETWAMSMADSLQG
ncbi:azlC family protein [Klebsiella pneumoniae]|nr:azlC family protein [Klebsiella pneumoniae]